MKPSPIEALQTDKLRLLPLSDQEHLPLVGLFQPEKSGHLSKRPIKIRASF
ncbi:hypothetical protein [Paenibacillus sp. JMULE4]|uniref:hypothetical protein n=1 Tax=Paenibacillus sp. JMULE4 TaxID=2518342 RepID=UPI00157740EA|nr:hypothetical protein [Paenibacillus sp. JMULE4]